MGPLTTGLPRQIHEDSWGGSQRVRVNNLNFLFVFNHKGTPRKKSSNKTHIPARLPHVIPNRKIDSQEALSRSDGLRVGGKCAKRF